MQKPVAIYGQKITLKLFVFLEWPILGLSVKGYNPDILKILFYNIDH